MNFLRISSVLLLLSAPLLSDNQTTTVSPIVPQNDEIPFRIRLEEASFSLPNGVHSGATANFDGKFVFIAGRTNGMHGFDPTNDNFPPQAQNKVVYVIDPVEEIVYSRSLDDPSSGLDQKQIDILSVTSPQSFQNGDRLYITGGYGVDSATGKFDTKNTLTAIDLPGLIDWVVKPLKKGTLSSHIRQTAHPFVKVTGGFMTAVDNHLSTLLIFGQDFKGYYTPESNGKYTNQVRRFQIVDTGKKLYVMPKKSEEPNPSYRRRDLNVAPIITDNEQSFLALSGVFTLTGGIWTVPVKINLDGSTWMANPDAQDTFKQGMNNYNSSIAGLYSKKTKDMYLVLLGGITFGYFSGETFLTDPEFPFTNQVTTVRIDQNGVFNQFFMEGEFPVILSTGSNPGNPLLFGAAAQFFPTDDIPLYSNGVIRLDQLESKPLLLGYIAGGIMSTLPNTNNLSDSAASPYIFRVFLDPL